MIVAHEQILMRVMHPTIRGCSWLHQGKITY